MREIATLLRRFARRWNRLLNRAFRKRRLAEAALQASEARICALVDDMPGAIYRCALDEQRSMETLSDGVEVLSGYPASDFIGNRVRSYASIIDPDDVALVDRIVHEAVAARRPYAFDYRIRHASGGIRWIREKGCAIFGEQGEALRLDGIFFDITKHRRLQEAFENKRALYTAMFTAGNAIKLLIDPADGGILDANPAACAFYGYPHEQLLQLNMSDLNALSPAEVAAEMGRSRSGNRGPVVLPHRLANGDIRTVEVYSGPIALDGRSLLFASIHDITERQAVEAALIDSRSWFRSLFDHMGEGVALHDLVFDEADRPVNYVIRAVNPHYEALTGLKAEAVIGKTADLAYGAPQPPYLEEYARVALTGQAIRFEIYFPPLNRYFSISAAPWGERGFATLFTDITALKRHHAQLERMAHYDGLTQLPNRTLLADRMRQALAGADRSGKLLAICYIDLDNFKPINDALGHAMGDQLLMGVANRLRDSMRGGDTVARLGGDEFVLLLTGLDSSADCNRTLARLLAILAAPYALAEHQAAVSASIGVTLYPPDHSEPDELLRHADQAMYIAKQSGRNRYHLFDPENDRRARAHCEALVRLKIALDQREFSLYYQPKIDMRQGVVIGTEALIRWRHPEYGLILPGEFLPVVAEDADFAAALGDWVLAEVLRQMEQWLKQGLKLPVSVNIAARHLQHPEFINRLTALLETTPDIDPDQLELEILETAALDDMALSSRVIRECRQMGVTFALDNFGAGYSSLTYFKQLPVNVLKIDQSFVRGMLDDAENFAIVAGVIGLAEAFQRQPIAGGVETVEHGLFLLQLGCDLAQGYGIAQPMPAEAIPAWVRDFRPDPLWEPVRALRWSRDDFPLLAMRVEHRHWVKQLAISLDLATVDSAPPPSLDAGDCRFGRWLHSHEGQRYNAIAAFQAMNAIHQVLHDLGKTLFDLHRAGHTGQARARLPELQDLSRQLQENLQAILTAVARPQ
ncbi:MAG: EAL domain-containing protein [Candidatus Contendobacter sp.]|nr:EAL domain-containing protein [Candidatus Contendobacter sp.]